MDIYPVFDYSGSMRIKDNDVLRRPNGEKCTLVPVSIRVPAKLWEKCGWAAAAVGLDRTTFVRNALTHVAREAKPPANAKSREILASDEEWAAWDQLAKDYDTTIDYLVRRSLNRVVDIAKSKAASGKRPSTR